MKDTTLAILRPLIAIQQTVLAEFESKARRIRRQLEVLPLKPEGEASSSLMEYAAEMTTELQTLTRHIEGTKRHMAAATWVLEANRRELNAQEEQYRKKLATERPQSAKTPADE